MIVYVGNIISGHGKTATTIETLGNALRAEGFEMLLTSDKKNKLFRLEDMLWTVFKHRKKIRYVLIDTYSTTNFYYAYLVSKLCQSLNLKYIPILHGGNLEERLKSSPKKSKAIFENAHVNVAPSQFLQHVFGKYGFENVFHIPNSISLSQYPFTQRNSVEANILWVRSFAEIYNPQMAIHVANELQKQGMQVNLCMVGPDKDGSLETTKSLAESLGISVEFTGKLTKNEWISLSKNYDIFINTTNFDNTPVSVMEAMALGMPIVSTNIGGLPYLIDDQHNGILVNANDISEMTQAIIKLIQSPEKAAFLSENARNKAEQFDWKIVKEKWRKLLV